MEYQRQHARERHIAKLSHFLSAHNAPRTEMALIVLLTGASGFMTSVLLLHLGLHAMWLRYALSVVAAYLVFLLLIRIWLALHKPLSRIPANERPDTLDLCRMTGESLPYGPSDGPSHDIPDIVDIDLGELMVYLALAAATLSLAASSAYVMWIAPEFFAEVLLDGVLTVGIYRRLRGIDTQHWTVGVLRRTALPALFVLLTLTITGAIMQFYAPNAESLGQVWAQLMADLW
jgi:hypothetical protein